MRCRATSLAALRGPLGLLLSLAAAPAAGAAQPPASGAADTTVALRLPTGERAADSLRRLPDERRATDSATAGDAGAADSARTRPGLRAGARATATVAEATRARTAPTLDGRDDDPVWAEAQVIDRFLEYEPNTGAETRFKTEVRVLYDDRYLYLLGRMHDPAPDSIVSLLSRRDVRTASEQLKVVIDSYHDRRTGYQFAVNPAGVKRDFYVYNDNIEDGTWDAVWDVATGIDSLGWVAEFRIPLSQLRFPNRPEHTFGLLVVRDVQRTGARISWPLFRRDRQGYVSQAGELTRIRELPTPRRLELAPYVVTKNVTQARAGGASGFRHPQQAAVGGDLKFGLTSNLTIDATVNPDFGQVEADPAVLNLSAFEQFFEERRPFFLEGAGIFSFRTSCGDIDTGCRGLFYSRRIGRAPQLAGEYGDEASPSFSPILGAAKLTGRLGGGLSVGVLDAVTGREAATGDRTIEPRTNYATVRLQQDLLDGQSGIGAMVTAVNRDLDAWSSPYLRRAAYTAGLDGRHRFLDRNYEIAASLSGSRVSGDAAAIARLQRDGVHRYQRPDDDVALDTTRTALDGFSQRVSVSKFGGGNTRFQTVYQRFTPGYEINDLGFQTRADDQLWRNWFAFQLQQPTRFYRRAFLNFNFSRNWTTAGMPTGSHTNTNQHIELPSFWWVHWGASANNFLVSYDDRVARGGPALRRATNVELWGGVESDSRKPLGGTLFGGRWRSDEGRSKGVWLEPSVNLRASSRFSGSIGVNYSRDNNDSQWVGNDGVAGVDTTHYTFARLEQTTLSLTTRLNVTATPTLSLQVYAQPFVSTGAFSNLRELADPRAARYADRFRPYAGDAGGIDSKQLRSNTVLRWEYRPGSALFVVWQHGRDAFDEDRTNFSFRRDYRELFTLHPSNTFLVKLSYWMNP